jgi:parallel beta-helix repeat protein
VALTLHPIRRVTGCLKTSSWPSALGICAAVLILADCTQALPNASSGDTIVVQPGQSIQAAVDHALTGATIVVEPGTYHETGRACPFDANQTCAVSITKDAITLIASASRRVVLENQTEVTNGIAVGTASNCATPAIRGSRIAGFVVTGFAGSGIVVSCVDDWNLSDVSAIGDKLYGFYASFVAHGRLDDSVAEGAAHAGIHIGLSHEVRVDHNVVEENVIGLEVREMLRATLDHNTAFDNTAGIFESIMPGDALERSSENVLSSNIVRDNNRKNACVPGDPVCLVRPGVGIAVIGGEHNVQSGNRVTANRTFGIAVLDACTAYNVPKSECDRLGFDPLPRDTRTQQNIVLNNGIDLLWTANGSGNCWSENSAGTTVPRSLPPC